MTQAVGWSDCDLVSKWGDHLPTDILGRYITTSGTMTLTAWWNYIHPQWDHFSLMVQSWSLYINFGNMYLLAVKICNMTVSACLWNALWAPTCYTEIHPQETFIYLCSSTIQRWLTSWRWPPERQYLPFKQLNQKILPSVSEGRRYVNCDFMHIQVAYILSTFSWYLLALARDLQGNGVIPGRKRHCKAI